MESNESKKPSARSTVVDRLVEKRSPVIAEVGIDTDPCRRSRSVRDADELSDEEADAFFYA